MSQLVHCLKFKRNIMQRSLNNIFFALTFMHCILIVFFSLCKVSISCWKFRLGVGLLYFAFDTDTLFTLHINYYFKWNDMENDIFYFRFFQKK